MLTSEQIRAARAMLRMDQVVLAERAGVSSETIKRLERSDGVLRAQESTLQNIRSVLENAGIVFMDAAAESKEGGPGIRLAADNRATEWNEQVESILGTIKAALEEELADRNLEDSRLNEAIEAALTASRKEHLLAVRDQQVPDMFDESSKQETASFVEKMLDQTKFTEDDLPDQLRMRILAQRQRKKEQEEQIATMEGKGSQSSRPKAPKGEP